MFVTISFSKISAIITIQFNIQYWHSVVRN